MNGPLALVTGGQQGIGLGIAEVLIAQGFHVAIASLPPVKDAGVRKALASLGPNASYYQHDLAEIAGIPALIEAIEKQQGPVHALIQNAGVAAKVRGDMLEITPENLNWIMGINLGGAFFLAQAVAKRMLATTSAHYRSITFVTSVSAELVSIERGEYCISKAGLSMAVQLWAARLAPHNIQVFEVRPGVIRTDMIEKVKDVYEEKAKNGLLPQGRLGDPVDVARPIRAIADGLLDYGTGTVLNADGGFHLRVL